MICIEPSIN